MNKAQLPINY